MSVMASGIMPEDEKRAGEAEEKRSQYASPGGGKEVKWEIVARTGGLAPAQIIANRLLSEGIPAQAWQEGAGRAIGLTVGLLGDGYVIVPENHVDRANEILASTVDEEWLEEDE